MKNLSRLLVIGLLLAVLVIPAAAQDLPEGAGEGGTVVLSNSAGDPATWIPFIYSDATSADIIGRIYPSIFGISDFTGLYEPGYKGTLATAWEFDDTGTVLTVHLREDAFWNDGTQITTADVLWGFDAMRSGLLQGPRAVDTWAQLDDGTPGNGLLVDVVAVDDFTFQLVFDRPDCQALKDVFDIVVPAHVFEEDFGDDLAAMNDDPRYFPGVSWNVWTAPELIPGDRVTLIADQSFPDTELGYVSPSDFVYLSVPDQDVEMERFLAGEITIQGIPGDRQAEFVDNPDWQTYRWTQNGFGWIAMNEANPDNPQPGYDDDGNRIIQDPHPILADKLVRQAITLAIDVDSIIENTAGGNGVRTGTGALPMHFHYNPDQIWPFDPVAAGEKLDEAGWVLEEGSEWRVCRGCFYTTIDPSYEGTEMHLTFNATSGSSETVTRRFEFIAQSLRDVGINVELEWMDWSSAFLPALLGQTFDLAMLQWSSLGLPVDPDMAFAFGTESDIPGAGFNVMSYSNPELDQIYEDARDPALTDGCTLEGRLPYYERANEIIFDELPYVFMYGPTNLTAAQPWLENWNPAPFNRTWQEDAWVAVEPSE